MKKNTEKIYVLKDAWTLFFILYLFVVIGLPVLYIREPQASFYRSFVSLLLIGGCIGFQLLTLIIKYRELTYVKETEYSFTSYFLSKPLCVVDKYQQIYYGIFTAKISKYTEKEFIVLCNNPFDYFERCEFVLTCREKPFFNTYDVKKYIVMPYNKKTKDMFDLLKWTYVPKRTEPKE